MKHATNDVTVDQSKNFIAGIFNNLTRKYWPEDALKDKTYSSKEVSEAVSIIKKDLSTKDKNGLIKGVKFFNELAPALPRSIGVS